MKTVFFDIDTQIDFLYPAGALYVPHAERVVPAVAHLNRYAATHGIPLVSSMDAHGERDPEFQTWPAHCVAGTTGQAKPASTLLEKRVVLPNAPGAVDIVGVQQVIVEKQTLNVFDTVTIDSVLAAFTADRYLVYGVVTEYCVRFAALGLLKTGKPVDLVTDAVETLNADNSARMLAEFQSLGGKLTTVAQCCQG